MFDNFRRPSRVFWFWVSGIVSLIVIVSIISIIFVGVFRGPDSRVVYSLDKRNLDQEIIHVIDGADHYVYFAIYYFTKTDIADALIRAKLRGVTVSGIMDAAASLDSNKKIVAMLQTAGISLETQQHQDGIMHMKAIVTDKAYASGSYNWTDSATEANDEVLEIGTDKNMHDQYLSIIKKVLAANASGKISDATKTINHYDYTEAVNHVGELATVSGTAIKVFTSKGGVTFFDFCKSTAKCPFSAIIFSSDLAKFHDVSQYQRNISVTGIIRSYQGSAEIVISDPVQIK